MTQNLLADALLSHLTQGALPGELEDFTPEARADAARFLADTARCRAPGEAALVIESVERGPGRRLRLAAVNDDMPFLVDSIAAAVAAEGIAIDRILHPVLPVRREADGMLAAIGDAPDATRESMIYLEAERADARTRQRLHRRIAGALEQVRAAVTDWRAMAAALEADATMLDTENPEGAALLRWFADGRLTLLGHARWAADGAIDNPLGIVRAGVEVPLLADASRARAHRWFEGGGVAPLLLKSNCLSQVHRRAPIDLVVLPIRDAGGTVTGLSLHAGLWTSAALNARPDEVPGLRRNLASLQEKLGFDPRGHAGKAFAHALSVLPHDLTTAFPAQALEQLALTAMSVADRPRSRVVLVRSALGRHLFGFVWLPRDEVSTARRLAIGELLAEAAHARELSWSMAMEGGEVALIRYVLDLREGGVMPDAQALDARIGRMVRGWRPAVEAALEERAPAAAARLALRLANAFPPNYRNVYSPEDAAEDVLAIAELSGAGDRAVRIVSRPGGAPLQIRVYRQGGALALSDAVPALENFGFRVVEEYPTRLGDEDGTYIHVFEVTGAGGAALPAFDQSVASEAIAQVLEGRAENDGFNRLVVEAGIAPDAAVLFRAWFRYLRQAGLSYGLATVVDALRRAPDVAAALIDRFRAVHAPDAGGDDAAARADTRIEAGLDAVSAIDDDRILRAFRAVVAATLRTNAFAPAGQEALAFKLDSAMIPGLPKPLPWREVFVYSPRIEGIHLRAGPVARGGLRWSDRRDDFRTEILGLMKAQRVKNAVIVPTGAKGGFYPKQLPAPANRDAWMAEGTESYRIFIRALLSITDNIVGGEVVHPADVRVLDGEDPYFVVAADKGTATFSDVANALAIERGFWLGDAFASGGSNGYDHKAMGITARGGWVSVQRHFLEMGVDVQSDSVRVIGCGDMSGDVFGNGMLLSKTLKLVAAFDHRHIFLDPDPDPAASWAERDRLFRLPRSSWTDYDPALISAGGGVFARTAKTVPLSEEVRTALGIEDAELEPGALISAILRSPADLLWFGGIGTYVKAATESAADVGDPANDRLRINADELRVKVVGEGANLGVTQAARIAFALNGGRINTDFIDNSAGVDCSDNEVNIKIALNREVAEDRLARADRDRLLAAMTEDVAALVLEDNRLQTLALSMMDADGAMAVPSYVRAIELLEANGRLDRRVEGLAGNDVLRRRAQDGAGLTRPELAVLLASTKLALQDAVEDAPIAASDDLLPDLLAAFPPAMQEAHGNAIRDHRLRPQIAATKVANRIVNRLGVLPLIELAEEEGAAPADIAAMFVAAERLFGLPDLWHAIETAEMAEAARLALLAEVASGVRSKIAELLRTRRSGEAVGALIAELGDGVAALDAAAADLVLPEVAAQRDRLVAHLRAAGAPAPLAAHVARLFELDGAIGLSDLGRRAGTDPIVLTRAFTELGAALGLDWAQSATAGVTSGDPWERLLLAGLSREFGQLRLDFLARKAGDDPRAAVSRWLEANRPRVKQFAELVGRARQVPEPTAAMLAQIASQARVLLAR